MTAAAARAHLGRCTWLPEVLVDIVYDYGVGFAWCRHDLAGRGALVAEGVVTACNTSYDLRHLKSYVIVPRPVLPPAASGVRVAEVVSPVRTSNSTLDSVLRRVRPSHVTSFSEGLGDQLQLWFRDTEDDVLVLVFSSESLDADRAPWTIGAVLFLPHTA